MIVMYLIEDLVFFQDGCVPSARELMTNVDQSHLHALYVVDSALSPSWYHNSAASLAADAVRSLTLTTLVLSRTRLRKLPQSMFEMESLQILKVDQNQLCEVPADIGKLKQLKVKDLIHYACSTEENRFSLNSETFVSLVFIGLSLFTTVTGLVNYVTPTKRVKLFMKYSS